MGSSAQIIRPEKSLLTEEESVREFLGIIRPLGFAVSVSKYDNAVYMHPQDDEEKGVQVWVDPENAPIYTINGKEYWRTAYFDFIWDDERYGPESMNSDMILAITAEYMKQYPDALFQFEWSYDTRPFLDKSDIDAVIAQPFQPGWFGDAPSHLHAEAIGKGWLEWKLE